MKPNRVNISKATMAARNAAKKRKWNVEDDIDEPMANYPNDQRSCNPIKCKGLDCDHLTIEYRQSTYMKYAYCTADEKCIIVAMSTWRVTRNDKECWKYTLPKDDRQVELCRTNFAKIMDISFSAIGRIQDKLCAGDIFPRNMTGRHDNRPHKISEDFKEAAIEHMLSYPRVNNHYSREHVDEETIFLKPPLTIIQMYNEFIDLYDDDDEVDMKMSEAYFRQLFHLKKMRIGVPLMDTCAVCDTHQNQIDNNRNPRKVEKHRQLKEAHLKKVDEAQRQLRSDRERSKNDPDKVAVIMIDAQKTLYTPQLSCANAYFGTKYASRNLCINDEARNNPTMFLWNQTTAGIGANEVGSCILKYVVDNFEPLEGNQERELIVWSDRCKAQNNNWQMLCLFAQLRHLKFFTSVKQRFLITGHSYNSCDSNFGLIEKRLRVDRVVYPPEFESVLRSARHNNPFTIVWMTQDLFYSLQKLCRYLKKPNELKVSRNISFSLKKNKPNSIFAKTTHAEDCPEKEYVMTFYGKLINVSEMPLITNSPAYPGGLIPIRDGLRADLGKLMRFVPPRAKEWFKCQLRIGQEESDNEGDSDNEAESSDDE